ncbi:MAG: RNA polymerase subunit sigma-24 [uncultured Thiotrichaceae bacterium]|uniref:RNA polymerase subunit sigma-24 n=1 Tax=uncultured Thiotrichaceae bacterium TaxID=298394 RepID=A0A6S6TKN9_9GAMM|nr:MAG: RNA polymerase subunit sigma-24 [uncultured Thiotrichaceae bacterium]
MDALNTLLEKTAQQDERAFQELYQILSPKLFGLALRLSNFDHEAAEDTLQEAFIKIWNKAHQFDANKATAHTWIARIIRNTALDKIRSSKSRPILVGDAEYESMEYATGVSSPEQKSLYEQQLAILNTQLTALPEKQRECVSQSIIHGYTHSEISQKLDVPLGTVKAWIRRSLKQLRDELSDTDTYGFPNV